MSRAILIVFAASLLVTRIARAQAVDPDALVHEGVELRRAGNDADALDRFRRAYEAGHRLNALGMMGFAEQALGQWAAAARHVREALAHPEDAWVQRNQIALETSSAAIDLHVGRLEVIGEPVGAEVSINGQSAGTLPLGAPTIVESGDASIVVQLPHYLPIARTVHVGPGELARATIRLERVPVGAAILESASAPPRTAAASRTGTPRWLVPVAIGGSAVVVAAIVVVAVIVATSGSAPIAPGTWGVAQER